MSLYIERRIDKNTVLQLEIPREVEAEGGKAIDAFVAAHPNDGEKIKRPIETPPKPEKSEADAPPDTKE